MRLKCVAVLKTVLFFASLPSMIECETTVFCPGRQAACAGDALKKTIGRRELKHTQALSRSVNSTVSDNHLIDSLNSHIKFTYLLSQEV